KYCVKHYKNWTEAKFVPYNDFSKLQQSIGKNIRKCQNPIQRSEIVKIFIFSFILELGAWSFFVVRYLFKGVFHKRSVKYLYADMKDAEYEKSNR
ncbi:MAG: hypothetical protein U9N77_07840, partial [Thermodesulfobacteriota bacterium]|nr:hypothetical protein [Thermodesulfobacteriota bacterium]